ncbi:MAG: hypothetical protein ACHP6H_01495, partial [Legionellales bacterium]
MATDANKMNEDLNKKSASPRKLIEDCVSYLKNEAKIGDACKSTRLRLIHFITQKDLFSSELVAYFANDNPESLYDILPSDPSQVAVLKKVLNALRTIELAVNVLEQFHVDPNRYTLAMVFEALMALSRAMLQTYEAMDLINQSGPEIQFIIGPQLNTLLPQLAATYEWVAKTNLPEAKNIGEQAGSLIKKMPASQHNEDESLGQLSVLIYDLPAYFEEINRIISSDDFKSNTSSAYDQANRADQAERLQKKLKKLSKSTTLHIGVDAARVGLDLLAIKTDLGRSYSSLSHKA